MAPELVAGGGFDGLIRKKPYCGQWGQLSPTAMRLWGQNYVIAPTEIRRERSERYK